MNLLQKLEAHKQYMQNLENCRYSVLKREKDYVVRFQVNGQWKPLTYVYSKDYAYAVLETLYWISGYKDLTPHKGALKYIREWIPRLGATA